MKILKGTVSREKLFSWGPGVMDWTLTIDCTWVLHFPDQLFNCYNCLTVSLLDVKPVWWLSETVLFRWLIWHAVVAIRCLLVCGLQQFVWFVDISAIQAVFSKPNKVYLFWTYRIPVSVLNNIYFKSCSVSQNCHTQSSTLLSFHYGSSVTRCIQTAV